jgi:biotin transporter BioY
MDWSWQVGPITTEDAARLGPIVAAIFGVIAGWIIICAVTGWLAARKNRDSGLWTVLAFFTGPIALLAICLLDPAPRTADRPSGARSA